MPGRGYRRFRRGPWRISGWRSLWRIACLVLFVLGGYGIPRRSGDICPVMQRVSSGPDKMHGNTSTEKGFSGATNLQFQNLLILRLQLLLCRILTLALLILLHLLILLRFRLRAIPSYCRLPRYSQCCGRRSELGASEGCSWCC